MKSIPPWASALNINDATLEAWAQQAPPEENLTFWCLSHGKIDQKQYLLWARNHYGLASLEQDFFKQPANLKFWHQVQAIANWSPYLLPIAEWDGVVFIACVEPLDDILWSFPVQYVLADSSDLAQHWQSLTTEQPVIQPTDQPANASVPAPPPETSAEEITATDIPPLPVDDLDAADSPAGLVLDQPEGLNLSADVQLSATEAEATDEITADAPAGLSMPEGLAMPEGLSMPSAESAPSPQGSTELAAIIHQEEPAPAPTASAPGELSNPGDIAGATNEDQAMTWLFYQLSQSFDRSVVFIYENNNVKIWKIDPRWTPASPEALSKPYNTTDPSVFRIVKKTNLPYHGRVASSPVNDEFFRDWGLDSPPEHLTVCPLRVGGQHVGMVLAYGDSSSNTKQILANTENLVKELGAALEQVTTGVA